MLILPLKQCRIIQFLGNPVGTQHQDKGHNGLEQSNGGTIGIHSVFHTIAVCIGIKYVRIVQYGVILHQELLFKAGIQDTSHSQDKQDTDSRAGLPEG